MKTPYSAAIGVQRRDVDQIRVAISVAIDQVAGLDAARSRAERAVLDERQRLAEDPALPENRWFERMRAERARLAHEQLSADARLDQLRARAREAYGALRAVETAAERYVLDETRRIAAAEQAAADERAAMDFMRSWRLVRAAMGRRG